MASNGYWSGQHEKIGSVILIANKLLAIKIDSTNNGFLSQLHILRQQGHIDSLCVKIFDIL